ncbi:hypothetical protein GCM10025788_04530 [Serinicoccus chungangensis]
MVAFSLEYGMETWSLCAELAFRIRVSMSAIGSVMVMGFVPFLTAVSPRACGPGRPSMFQVVVTSVEGVPADGREGPPHQLDLVTPGSSPACAISRRQIRHRPNLR